MSILMNMYYRGINGNARCFAEEMESSGIADLIRAEKGNVRYAYYFPMDDPQTVLLIGEWWDQGALDRHNESPIMEKVMELRIKYGLQMRTERYVSGNAPVSVDKIFEVSGEFF